MDGHRVSMIPEWDADDPSAQGTGTINLHLTDGQLVQVENHGSDHYMFGTKNPHGYLSWFTGFLLHAD